MSDRILPFAIAALLAAGGLGIWRRGMFHERFRGDVGRARNPVRFGVTVAVILLAAGVFALSGLDLI